MHGVQDAMDIESPALDVARSAPADPMAAAFSEASSIDATVFRVFHVRYRLASTFHNGQVSTRGAVLAVTASAHYTVQYDMHVVLSEFNATGSSAIPAIVELFVIAWGGFHVSMSTNICDVVANAQ